MKKTAIIAALACMALNVFAAVTPTGKVNITLSSTSAEDKVLRLRLHSSFSDAFDNAWDATAAQDGGIYALDGETHYTTWCSDQLDNRKVGFKSCNDLSYTLTFSNFAGENIRLYDLVADVETVINASTPAYVFTIDGADVNKNINDRFILNYIPNPAICHRYGKLQITDCKGMTVKVLNMDGSATSIADTNITSLYQEIDLAGLAAGQYKVEWNSQTLIIDVK